MWRCPLCQTALSLSPHSAQCENNHIFDRAKSGYLNLLPVQFKKSKQPGDDKTMLRARQRFHQHQGYAPLMEMLASKLLNHLDPGRSALTVFDAGCGEGTYLDRVCTALGEAGHSVQGAGGDIAKIAVDIAAKAYKQHQFVVASSVKLPLEDACIDVFMQIFAPGSTTEQTRVLRNDGILVTVDPGPGHLFELKQQVYTTPIPHPEPTTEREGFVCIEAETLRYPLSLQSSEQKSALLAMTPYMWRVAPEKREALAEQLTSVTAEFAIRLWQPA